MVPWPGLKNGSLALVGGELFAARVAALFWLVGLKLESKFSKLEPKPPSGLPEAANRPFKLSLRLEDA